MSIDWDKRQGTLGKHKHLAADILSEATGVAAPVSGDALQVVTRTLTSAEILALDNNTGAIVLVEGQPGLIYVIVRVISVSHFGTTPYAFDGNLGIDGGQGNGLSLSNDLLIGLYDIYEDVASFGTAAKDANDNLAGSSLYVYTNGGAIPIDGDGTLDMTVLYRVVDAS